MAPASLTTRNPSSVALIVAAIGLLHVDTHYMLLQDSGGPSGLPAPLPLALA